MHGWMDGWAAEREVGGGFLGRYGVLFIVRGDLKGVSISGCVVYSAS